MQALLRFSIGFSLFAALLVTVPKVLAGPEKWEKDIQQFEQWDARNAFPKNPILFVGSSSIRMWHTQKYFENLPVINRGFGGSTIPDVLHYFDRLILPYQPRLIVFYSGDNDIASGRTPEQVRDDFKSFAGRTHEKFPQARILHLPVKPSLKRWSMWPTMAEANRLVAGLCKNMPYVQQVDLATPMLDAEGRPRPELFLEDGLHLTPDGYALWSKILLPLLLQQSPRDP